MNRAPTDPSTYYAFRPGHPEIWRSLTRNLRRGGKLLDVGCGPGVEALAFVSAGIDAHYTGVDIAEDAICLARDLPSITARCSFALAPATELPFRTETFGVVTFFLSLHQVDDPAAALREAIRVVRDDGVVAILVIEQDDWEHAIEYECFPNLRQVEIAKSGRLNVEAVRVILGELGRAATTRRFEYFEQRIDKTLLAACRRQYFSSLRRLSPEDFSEGIARLERVVRKARSVETRSIGCTVLEVWRQ